MNIPEEAFKTECASFFHFAHADGYRMSVTIEVVKSACERSQVSRRVTATSRWTAGTFRRFDGKTVMRSIITARYLATPCTDPQTRSSRLVLNRRASSNHTASGRVKKKGKRVATPTTCTLLASSLPISTVSRNFRARPADGFSERGGLSSRTTTLFSSIGALERQHGQEVAKTVLAVLLAVNSRKIGFDREQKRGNAAYVRVVLGVASVQRLLVAVFQ